MPPKPKPADDPSSPLDPILSKKTICRDLGIHPSTLDKWIKQGHFPPPVVLNEGVGGREIIGWLTSTYATWKAPLPQRQAKPIAEKAYEKRRRKREPRITRPTE